MILVLLRIVVFASIMVLGLGNGLTEAQSLTPILLVQTETESEFTLPETVYNLTKQPGVSGTNSVNFQTDLSLTEAIDFYRQSLTEQGLKEREINTAITETTFNLVFEGVENGLAVVVQGVDLGELTNVNIRYEKLD
ncbi:hypothetical protein M595_0486 [Lyngbya aestuarii BL J]|uniref:Uncharacterized protein n=1 Tax=Lyngbya aestuarii BL J TaxID=1348334 RepID=U7QQS5_9CYAN|nr:hypothetical protein [Lyngbya aestuarii]ERT09435.1 hypothetical protein M595_0486 [Lyngbya aestuarii BL J]